MGFNMLWVHSLKECLEGGLASTPGLNQRRPAVQEIAEQDRVALLEPVMGLRIILFEVVS